MDREGRLTILPFSDELAQHLLERIPPDERESTVRLALEDGSLLDDGDAVSCVLERLSRTRGIARATRLPLGRGLTRALYATVAANRDHLARFVRDRPPVIRRPGDEN